MTPRTFWMVYVSHKSSPTHRHPSKEGAMLEAIRLARLPDNVGRKVYMLEAKNYCVAEPGPLLWMKLY